MSDTLVERGIITQEERDAQTAKHARWDKKRGEGYESEGLKYAESYKYEPSLKDRVLDKLPLVGGKRAYDRSQDYTKKTFFNPSDIDNRNRMNYEGVSIYQKLIDNSSAYTETKGGKLVKNLSRQEVGSRSLHRTQGDEREFLTDDTYQIDDHTFESVTFGSQAGYLQEESQGYDAAVNLTGTKSRSVDPYNVTSQTHGKYLFGKIPVGFSGSIKKNPGINPYIDTNRLKKQVDNFSPESLGGGNMYTSGHRDYSVDVVAEKAKPGNRAFNYLKRIL